jgi:hypothetical protein
LIELNALGAALFVLLTLGHDGRTKAAAKIVGELVELGVAIDLNSLFGGVADYVTIVAPGKVVFQLSLGLVVKNAVQIVGQLVKEFRAFHWLPSPLEASPLFSVPFSRL